METPALIPRPERTLTPDLRLHRVLRRAVELLDPKMLLDPLEEEFHLPAAFVERADGGGRKREVVGDEDQRLAGLGALEADAPQKFGVILTGVEAVQGDGLVANDAGRAIRRRRIDAMSIDVRLGTRDEEGPGLVQHIKAGKVDVATIHDVDGSGFRQEHIEGMNVVQLAIRGVDKTRNVAPQVEQRVHLHRRLGGAEVRPRKDRQAQSDGRRVQGVDGIGQVQPQGKLVHSLGLSWLDRGAAFPRMIGSPVGRFADGGMSGPRWGSGYGLTITCRHIGALRLRSGAGPSAWRFALPVEGGRALRVSGWVVAVYWRSF